MEYSFVGFLIPAKSENDANNIICQIDCIIADSECDLSNAYSIAGIPVIDDINAFCKDFEQFLAKYSQKLHNMIDEE
jgi:hypothetical protein